MKEAIIEIMDDPEIRVLLMRKFVAMFPIQGAACNTPAKDVAPGDFGADCTAGNYSFPADVGIRGTGSPDGTLHVFLGPELSASRTYTVSNANQGIVVNTYNTNAGADADTRHVDLVALGDKNNTVGGSMFRFFTNTNTSYSSVERMRITREGNVGIGTTSPGSELEISGNSTSGLLTFDNSGSSAGNIGYAGSDSITLSLNRGLGATRNCAIYDGTTNSVLYVDKTSKVGIGTTDPTSGYKLDVVGDQILSGTGAKTLSFRDIAKITAQTNEDIQFWNSKTGDTVIIDEDGNVGIGTASPTKKLDVEGDTRLGGSVYVENSGSLRVDTIQQSVAANDLLIRTEPSTDKNIIVMPDGTGRVGIGTTSPDLPLHVQGPANDSQVAVNNGVEIDHSGSAIVDSHTWDRSFVRINENMDNEGNANHGSANQWAVNIQANVPDPTNSDASYEKAALFATAWSEDPSDYPVDPDDYILRDVVGADVRGVATNMAAGKTARCWGLFARGEVTANADALLVAAEICIANDSSRAEADQPDVDKTNSKYGAHFVCLGAKPATAAIHIDKAKSGFHKGIYAKAAAIETGGNFIEFAGKFKVDASGLVDTTVGYRVGNSAPSGNFLRGDGTNFVSNTIQPNDLPDASPSQKGAINTSTQSFAGDKTFQDDVVVDNLSVSDGNITNVGSISLDTILPDDGSLITMGAASDTVRWASGAKLDLDTNDGVFLVRSEVSASAPSTVAGELMIWQDTGTGQTKLLFDDGASQLTVQLT